MVKRHELHCGRRWQNTGRTGGRKSPLLGEGKRSQPLPLEGANVNEKDLGGSWLNALHPLGPTGPWGGLWGPSALRLHAAALPHLQWPQRAGPSAACCRSRWPALRAPPTPQHFQNTRLQPRKMGRKPSGWEDDVGESTRWGLNVLPNRCYHTLLPVAPPDATS